MDHRHYCGGFRCYGTWLVISERLIGDESREVDVFRKIKDLYAMLKCYPEIFLSFHGDSLCISFLGLLLSQN